MASTATEELRRRDAVVASVDLRNVPAGTKGKVAIVNGLKWIRYWVRFDNGESIGSLDRSKLATPAEWDRALNGEEERPAAGAVAAADGDGSAADAPSAGGGVTTSSGTVVPQKLIDRTAAARARLGK